MNQPILVWDLPTRIFHWALVSSFTAAFLTAESERWRDVHVLSGYALLGLIAFRLVWGVIGSRYARFAEFVRGPAAVIRYLGRIVKGKVERSPGHNPVGAAAILALLLLGVASGLSGWALYEEIGGEWLEELHEFMSNAMLAVVAVHVAGVLASSHLHGENLILAMFTGRKRGEARQAIPSSHPLAAVFLLSALIGVLTWAWSDSKDARPSFPRSVQSMQERSDND